MALAALALKLQILVWSNDKDFRDLPAALCPSYQNRVVKLPDGTTKSELAGHEKGIDDDHVGEKGLMARRGR